LQGIPGDHHHVTRRLAQVATTIEQHTVISINAFGWHVNFIPKKNKMILNDGIVSGSVGIIIALIFILVGMMFMLQHVYWRKVLGIVIVVMGTIGCFVGSFAVVVGYSRAESKAYDTSRIEGGECTEIASEQ
jgi:hypothetical protein